MRSVVEFGRSFWCVVAVGAIAGGCAGSDAADQIVAESVATQVRVDNPLFFGENFIFKITLYSFASVSFIRFRVIAKFSAHRSNKINNVVAFE